MNNSRTQNPETLAGARPPVSRWSIVVLGAALAVGLASLWGLFELQRMPYRPPEDMSTFFGYEERLAVLAVMGVIGVLWVVGAVFLGRLVMRRCAEMRGDEIAEKPLQKELNDLLCGAAAVARAEEGLRAIGCYPHAKVRRRVLDAMAYGVYLSEDQKRVWIHMAGGVAGVSAWYGPFDVAREEARRVIEAMRPEAVAEKREGGR